MKQLKNAAFNLVMKVGEENLSEIFWFFYHVYEYISKL